MRKGFQSVGAIWWLTIPTAIVFSALLAHYSSIIPFEQLRFVGSVMQYFNNHYHPLVVIAFWATIIAHIYEASLARRMCQKLRMDSTTTSLWMIQTFIIGYPSLKILKEYLRQQR